MKSKLISLLAVLLAAVLLFAGFVPAWAAETGSLTLNITDGEDAPVDGFEVRLVRVADGNAKLVGAFKAANIAPEDLKKDRNNARNAKKLLSYAQYASSKKLSTDAAGKVLFENLSKGIYLVYDPGKQGYVFDPFLVMVPTAIAGTELYDIVANPKVESQPPDGPNPPPGPGSDPTPTPGPSDDPNDPTPTPGPSDDPNDPTPTPGPSDDPNDPNPTPGPSDDPSDPNHGGDPDGPLPTPPGDEGGEGGGSEDEPGSGAEGEEEGGEGEDEPLLPLTGVERRPIWILLALGAAFVAAGILQLTVRRREHE